MSITLELPAELEASIERAAQQRGTNMQLYIIEAARQRLVADDEVVGLSVPGGQQFVTATQPKTRSFGLLKGRISGSDAFLADKHAEAQRERQKEEAGA